MNIGDRVALTDGQAGMIVGWEGNAPIVSLDSGDVETVTRARVRIARTRHVAGFESLREITRRMETGEPEPRPTLYRGIQMRSRLEAAFAWHLDVLGEKWTYEPRIYGQRGKGYLPDFEILRGTRPTFIEVKPTLAKAEEAKRRMPVIWDTHPDAQLLIACAEDNWFFEALRGEKWASWQERWKHS